MINSTLSNWGFGLTTSLRKLIVLFVCRCCGWHCHVALIHSSYPLVVLTSTPLCSVVSIILAKLYRSVLLGLHLAPSLTFIGNTMLRQVSQCEQGENKSSQSFLIPT